MAIAFDSSSNGFAATGTGLTYSHTCTGSERLLLVSNRVSGTSDLVSSITYAGISLTKITDLGNATTSTNLWVGYLAAPSTGANNIVVTLTSASDKRSTAVSYTGANQSGQPDAFGTGSQTSSTSFTDSITTVADNSWIAFFTSNDVGGASNGTNYVQRTNSAGVNVGDTNTAITPAGSTSQTANIGSAANWAGIQVSFAPIPGVVAAGGRQYSYFI